MLVRSATRAARVVAAACTLGPLAVAGQLWTVDDNAAADFADIQSAISAAADGDTIAVRTGNYGDFAIDDKSLTLYRDTGTVNVVGSVFVSNLSKQKRVVISGINVTARTVWPTSENALTMTVNVGAIRIQNCTIKGGAGAALPPIECDSGEPFGAGGMAASLFYCTDLAFTGCTITGGAGAGQATCWLSRGGTGGHAIEARTSQVALYDCVLTGGRGGNHLNPGGDGGIAYRNPTGGFFACGSTFTGGAGGDTSDPNSDAGSGGAGVFVGTNGNALLLANTLAGGLAGHAFAQSPERPGPPLSGTGSVEQLSGTRRKCSAATFAAPSSMLTVTIAGVPGDQVFLPWSNRSSWRARLAHHGIWLIPYPARMSAQPIGVIPGSGTLVTQIPMAALPAGSEAELTSIQGFVIDNAGDAFLASPMQVVRR